MVSRCRSTIGKRPANTICDPFRSIPTDENGAIAKVEQSTPNLTSCGPCTSGVTRSSRMRSRCDLSESRASPWVTYADVRLWNDATGITNEPRRSSNTEGTTAIEDFEDQEWVPLAAAVNTSVPRARSCAAQPRQRGGAAYE